MVLKMSKSPADRKTMQQEIKTMYNLEHPNILRLMGLCVHDGKFHVLMEFINGGTLERLLFDSSMDLWWSVRLLLGHNIASGMAYLHSKGIIHRDLTSKNCLIKREKGRLTAVVADFGLAAKIPNSIHECDKTMSIVGSPYWMAPEVLGGRKYDEKADIFSYGIVLCEILARISADPDELPRTHNFGLDAESFQPLIDTGYPDEFFQLAIHCCQVIILAVINVIV
ncbi:uncharacterized protein TRIADDRAFT_28807 [Trichoplax adhaerens]|uniref:dual-specificity kinase n=1 Tax=Trichoplax adhaerens TaxID=10228 RepID=B3S3U9_TRIAD|nr:hypothetical protein TRIADDRAFT_28807 [Trichoplax adhaerens]EDV22528.1 hypothetical protein TRIADDRAFT_28807 [Trichoplax adhaerens]|eukprot:XP_002115072.1 hypothetical protein TRIADDRAFT_28807 [Trichoplax adhaerens]